MHKVTLIRIVLCVFVGILLISEGASLLYSSNVVNQILAIPVIGMGLMVVIFGFSPRLGKRIIEAIVDIVKIVLKAS